MKKSNVLGKIAGATFAAVALVAVTATSASAKAEDAFNGKSPAWKQQLKNVKDFFKNLF